MLATFINRIQSPSEILLGFSSLSTSDLLFETEMIVDDA
jgi:hypothetical protein